MQRAQLANTQPMLHQIILISILCLLFNSSPQPCRADAPPDLGAAMDSVVRHRSSNAVMMDRWFKSYARKNYGEADKIWAAILKHCANREEIGDFIENINERCWFADDSDSKKVDPEKAYHHLLVTTEKMLGKDHRFVADLCTFLATYAEARHDYQQAKAYRLRDLKLHEKALGANNHQVIEANQEVGHLLLTMKQYGEAEQYLKRAIVASKKQGLSGPYQKANADYLQLLHATKGDTKSKRTRTH